MVVNQLAFQARDIDMSILSSLFYYVLLVVLITLSCAQPQLGYNSREESQPTSPTLRATSPEVQRQQQWHPT